MKHFLYLIIFSIVLNACKKDNTQPVQEDQVVSPTPTPSQKKFSCLIDGVLFETDSSDSNILYIDSLANSKILACGGMLGTTFVGLGMSIQGVSLSLPTSAVNYPTAYIDIDRIVNGVYYDTYIALSSSVQITSNDSVNRKVSGIFSGIVVENSIHDTVQITNGKFINLSYLLLN